jgi:hypothetical protein
MRNDDRAGGGQVQRAGGQVTESRRMAVVRIQYLKSKPRKRAAQTCRNSYAVSETDRESSSWVTGFLHVG